MSDHTRVGVVGLGLMGSRVAARLAEAGRTVTVYDIDAAVRDRVASDAVTAVEDLGDVARAAEVVLLSVPRPEDVAAIVSSAGLLVDGAAVQLIIDLSTIDPQTARSVAAAAAERFVEYVDSPVLGRPEACGNWTQPMGGSEAATARAAEVCAPIAAKAVRVGEVGTASIIKLLNNLMFGAINAVTAEIMAGCRAAGLNPSVFFDVLSDSGAASISKLFLEVAPKMVRDEYSPNFTVELLQKDNAMAVAMLESFGVPTVMGSAVELVNRMGLSSGLGKLDTSALVKVYEHYQAGGTA